MLPFPFFSPDVLADADLAAIRWVGHELFQFLSSAVGGWHQNITPKVSTGMAVDVYSRRPNNREI